MNKLNLLSKFAIAGVVGAIGLTGIQSEAQASPFYDTVAPGTFAPDFFSVFGDVGPKGGGQPCPLCDSTVSTTAYRTLGDGDWTDDQALMDRGLIDPTFLKQDEMGDIAIDLDAEWVLFYQVYNTDPIPDGEEPLQEFSVTTTDKNGHPVDHKPYTSGGFYDQLVFANASTAIDPLDEPNDWEAQPTDLGLAVLDLEAINPASAFHSQISNNTIAEFPDGTAKVFEGVEFLFPNVPGAGLENIPVGGTSSILFLTANGHLDLVPAETESPGGEGAAGDVYGIKKAPEPGTILGLLAISGLGLGLKRKKQS
ncbi:MAG: PEP-CTERM sorting domain-containing protein [Crocosphaera sp.]|nr:PEP-CTERM sorting domain-containing protein [Crocosphaera sp.]